MVWGGEAGVPSVRTIWQPTPRAELREAMAMASSNAGPVAMRVAEVRTPAWWSSRMERLMPGVRPKSSALMMRRDGIEIKEAAAAVRMPSAPTLAGEVAGWRTSTDDNAITFS